MGLPESSYEDCRFLPIAAHVKKNLIGTKNGSVGLSGSVTFFFGLNIFLFLRGVELIYTFFNPKCLGAVWFV